MNVSNYMKIFVAKNNNKITRTGNKMILNICLGEQQQLEVFQVKVNDAELRLVVEKWDALFEFEEKRTGERDKQMKINTGFCGFNNNTINLSSFSFELGL